MHALHCTTPELLTMPSKIINQYVVIRSLSYTANALHHQNIYIYSAFVKNVKCIEHGTRGSQSNEVFFFFFW
jgi:hypothetical protein